MNHEATSGLWTRYRARYAQLSPGVQMIGLQLWLPLVFVVAFCLCYVGAFHAPHPQNIPTAVVGTSSQTTALAHQLQTTSSGVLSVVTEPSIAAARAEVRSGDLAAAYVPGAGSAQLIIASGASYQLAVAAKTLFTTVAAGAGVTLHVVDLAPLPASDSYGTTAFYVTLVWMIGGYMTAMFVGMMGAGLSHRTRFGIIAASSVLLPLITALLVDVALGAIPGHFLELWGLGVFASLAVGSVVNGLSYFLGRFVTGAALIIFVFANVPAAGGAYPPEFLAQPWRALHHVVSGTGTLDVLRDMMYGVGPGAGHGALIIACYLAAGLVLSAAGKPFLAWRLARRTARGAQPSMMISAQMAAMAAAAAARQAVDGVDAPHGAHEAPADPLTVDEIRTRQEANARQSEYASEVADGDAVAIVTGEVV